MEGEVVVGGEERNSFYEHADQRDHKVPPILEEVVVEHSVFLKLCLVNDQADDQNYTNDERAENVRVRPGVWVLRPRKSHAEKDQSSGKEKVPDPVQLAQFLPVGESQLGLLWRWIVQNRAIKQVSTSLSSS